MSAYSFVNHRMFVAALSNEAVNPRPVEQYEVCPGRAASEAGPTSDFRSQPARPPMTGVLLANALMNGYQAAVS